MNEQLRKKIRRESDNITQIQCVETLEVFNSYVEAAKHAKVLTAHMVSRAIKNGTTCGGYRWRLIKTGRDGKTYNSLATAAKDMSSVATPPINAKSSISSAANGRQKLAFGYRWHYVD